jgi:hypothetical protein
MADAYCPLGGDLLTITEEPQDLTPVRRYSKLARHASSVLVDTNVREQICILTTVWYGLA